MTINQSGWRPERPNAGGEGAATFTGNKALMLEEPLIFEIGDAHTTGVDFAEGDVAHDRLGGLTRKTPIGLPGLSEPETVRHYTPPQPPELRDRPGPVSARFVHDEA